MGQVTLSATETTSWRQIPWSSDGQSHRSITSKLATPTAPSCMDNIIYIRWSSRRQEPGCDAPVGNHSITRRSGTRRFHPPGARSQYRTPGTVAQAMAAWWHAPLVKTDGHNKRKQNADNTKEKMSFHKRPFISITSHEEYLLFSPANHLFSRQICISLILA